MFSLLLTAKPDQEDYLIGELWEAGTVGVVEEDGGIRAFFEGSDDAFLAARFAEYSPQKRLETPTNWVEKCQESWPPMRVGRFFLTPPWCADLTPEGFLRLEINPGMACGTGRHPCTQLCLEAIERYVKPGDAVLDVGSGSGILSNAARLLAAGTVVGCDIDPAVDAMIVGSVDAVRSNWADVIVANIDSSTIEQLAGEFERVRKPGSTLIVSGFPEWDIPAGLQPKETLRREEWSCLVC
ncbi:MAG TPA: 50S ribosomal protein L11 methyltransferase [Bryobacteraceae bacterium]|nr:50S ribosomal protein L11 methyltransferase [Bryobacteraceae bacterium]